MEYSSCTNQHKEPSEEPHGGQPRIEIQKGENQFALVKGLRGCETIVNGLAVRCECGCCDCYDYLHRPLLSACESVIIGFSPGPARDRQLLQILRAGHRADIEAYVREYRSDLVERHEAATAIVAEYLASKRLVDESRARQAMYLEALRDDSEDEAESLSGKACFELTAD